MTHLKEIENILRKVLEAFNKDRTLLIGFKESGINNQEITANNLCDLAGNHLFDDFPEKFGITNLEGHKIREYFQSVFQMNKSTQTEELLQVFKGLFDG